MRIPLAYKYNILKGIIGEVRYGFFWIYAPTPYSAVFLLHAPTPAPIKIGYSTVRCNSCGCVGEAYTPKICHINPISVLRFGPRAKPNSWVSLPSPSAQSLRQR